MTALAITLGAGLVAVAIAAFVLVGQSTAYARDALSEESEAKDKRREAEAKADRMTLAADTADSLRAASEERVGKLEQVVRRAQERTADALTAEPLVFASRADALAAARRLFAPETDVPDAAADRGDADADGGVPDLAGAKAAGRRLAGL
jgi:hypothetical protein